MLFDYMSLCVLVGCHKNVQLHDYDMKTDNAVQLHRLLAALCVVDHSKMLPVSENERFAFVAIVPEMYWRGPRHDVSTDMCTDLEYVRLCILPADQQKQSVLDKIKHKYGIETFAMKHVNDTSVDKVSRGSRFVIAHTNSEGSECFELELQFPSDNYLSA
jgi:hypothetical protein